MIRPFTIYILQMAHTDIGYTHPQELIEHMYLDFYDRVLELCRQTATAPIDQRFKWTCETFWQVHHYLTQRPEREEEFLHYVRAGQIEITATYLHFTDMIDSDAYRRSVEIAVNYCRQHDIPLKSAIHSDINGWPWSTADILHEFSIPYFCSHVHLDSATDPLGKRGSIHYSWKKLYREGELASDAPIRVPQMFWWQGPAKGRVLHWLNEHYHLGNVLGLSGTQDFSLDKSSTFTEADQTTVQELYEVAKREVPLYIEYLRASGYAHTSLLLSTGGFFVDNSPPDSRWCQIIEIWNQEHEEIKLRTATISEWFEDFQRSVPETAQQSYPTYATAWPDYWAHGLGSETASVALARRTQRRRRDVLNLIAHSQSSEAQKLSQIALEQERLSLEHTFGAWSSLARPGSQLNAFQQAAKALMFYRADLYLNEAATAALRHWIPQKAQNLHVSSLSAGTGFHTVHFAVEDLKLDPQQQVLTDKQGEHYPFQVTATNPAQYVAVLPLNQETTHHAFALTAAEVQAITPGATTTALQLETAHWKLQIDPAQGRLVSMQEGRSRREWVNPDHQYGFGQLVHEQVIHPWGRKAVSNQARLLALNVAGEQLRREMPQEPIFKHTSPREFQTVTRLGQPVFDEIQLTSKDPVFGTVQMNWRLYHALPMVEYQLQWDKPWSDLPEAAYIAFPFALAQGTVDFETGGGFFRPGNHQVGGQLPGTCSAYYTLQRAAHIQAEESAELLWLPLDAPLVMPDDIHFNHWETEPWQWNGFLASMPVNHYWHTNFAPSQRGPIQLRYRFLNPTLFTDREQAISAALPVEALGWR
ncbi:hypothetical protein [Tengunoibacter tsumagoiensis]|uniref:Glycoside hydrolase family 38 N-terminal domain-containing protein n=1 Tax=Tengunoibacter tsumagoiensis TaxID=2014871 RepID=A0A402AAG5_9CHLR|nr:hypothetical protein [Tengunoibacter tsumagoiensis]GCE16109.1 hypothetical protein KTT_59680 [Tengunoibacter tsumagoiensis]